MITAISKNKSYRVTIEEVAAGELTGKTLQLEYEDREDLFNVVEKLKQGSGLEDSIATRVGVALRLLGPIMMQNRKHPLFVEFMPHFKSFMQNLKNKVKESTRYQ